MPEEDEFPVMQTSEAQDDFGTFDAKGDPLSGGATATESPGEESEGGGFRSFDDRGNPAPIGGESDGGGFRSFDDRGNPAPIGGESEDGGSH